MCPDLKDQQDFTIMGDAASMKAESMQLVIDRCNNKTQTEMGREKCHEEKSINEWIKDVLVEAWSLERVVDNT